MGILLFWILVSAYLDDRIGGGILDNLFLGVYRDICVFVVILISIIVQVFFFFFMYLCKLPNMLLRYKSGYQSEVKLRLK